MSAAEFCSRRKGSTTVPQNPDSGIEWGSLGGRITDQATPLTPVSGKAESPPRWRGEREREPAIPIPTVAPLRADSRQALSLLVGMIEEDSGAPQSMGTAGILHVPAYRRPMQNAGTHKDPVFFTGAFMSSARSLVVQPPGSCAGNSATSSGRHLDRELNPRPCILPDNLAHAFDDVPLLLPGAVDIDISEHDLGQPKRRPRQLAVDGAQDPVSLPDPSIRSEQPVRYDLLSQNNST